MARTEQTPRNPVRDRPIAAVESDLCSIEGGYPQNLETKERSSTPPPTTPRAKIGTTNWEANSHESPGLGNHLT